MSPAPEDLCGELRARLDEGRAAMRDPGLATALAALAAELRDTRLRVTVGGRLNAGKSTLVNALLGQRLAATGAVETTRIATLYRHHHQNRVVARLRSGEERVLAAAPGGGLPDRLPVPADEVAELIVEAANVGLDTYAVVDTPGLDSLTGLDDVALAALARTDVLLYLMPHPGERDREALDALRDSPARRLSATRALGVLSRIDTLGDGEADPWPDALRVARRYAERLPGLVADVVPVAGLLAETGRGDAFTEADMRALERLADADRATVLDQLYAAAFFLGWADGPLDGRERARLVALLGTHGLRVGLDLLAGGPCGTTRFLAGLVAASGFTEIVDHLEGRFRGAARRHRAAEAVDAVERLRRTATGPDRAALDPVGAAAAALRGRPELRQLALEPALDDLGSGLLPLDDQHRAALVDLATGDSDAARLGLAPDATDREVAARCDEWARAWRTLEASRVRRVARHARAARELCEAIWFASAAYRSART